MAYKTEERTSTFLLIFSHSCSVNGVSILPGSGNKSKNRAARSANFFSFAIFGSFGA
jgi:hypothetical protein